jgi:predicted nucleic acid-binding protein
MVEMVLRTPTGELAARQVKSEQAGVHAPHLLDAEVGSVMRRLEHGGQVAADRALTAMLAFQQLPIRRYELTPLLPRAWELRKNLSIYDALYVALAEALGAVLLTSDKGLGRAPGSRVRIKVI